MADQQSILEIIEATAQRKAARREFIRLAGGATAMAGGLSLLAACGGSDSGDTPVIVTPTPTPAPVSDADILNFALNLEYLEAQFYSYAAFGVGLNANLLTGTGTQGAVASTGTGAGQPRAVTFTDPVVQQYAREIANDEIAHVTFLRSALGTAAVSQPALNISGDATGSFTAAARAAGVVGNTATFDPYLNDNNFLLGAFIFEDVGVTAYKGAAPLIANKTYLDAAAGILAVEAYHAGLVRTVLYAKGLTTADLRTNAGRISDLRDTLDGTPADNTTVGIGADDDQGITGTGTASNIVPTNVNGLAYSRSTAQVLNVVYAKSGTGQTSGGFFPAGMNGRFTST